MRLRPLAASLAKACLACLVLFFVGRELIARFGALDLEKMELRKSDIALCALCITATRFLNAVSYRNLTAGFGYSLPWKPALIVTWVPTLAKYVPGKLMGLAGAVYLFTRFDVPAKVGGSVAVLHFGLSILTGFLLVLVGAFWTPLLDLQSPLGAAVAACAVAGLFLLHPRILAALLHRMPGQHAELAATPDMRHHLVTLAMVLCQWLAGGLALWLSLRAVYPVSFQILPIVIASSALAMVAGALAIFVPVGLGVREGILLSALDPYAAPGAVAVAVIAIRLVHVVVELGQAGIGFLWLSRLPPATRAGRELPPEEQELR